jgi:hypothetical protein
LSNTLKPKSIQAYFDYLLFAGAEAKYGMKAFCEKYTHYDWKSFCQEYHPEVLSDLERNT